MSIEEKNNKNNSDINNFEDFGGANQKPINSEYEKWEGFLNDGDEIAFAAYKKKKKKKQRVPVEADEGVTNANGFAKAVSLNEIEALDLIGEGEIEGLVEGEYSYVGTLGNIGYDSATYNPYDFAPTTSIRWLRSVFWNDTPVVDSNNQFNFQNVSVSVTNGNANGTVLSSNSSELTVTRQIGERLRGAQVLQGAIRNDFTKTYRLLNRNANACRVYVKVNQLFQSFPSGNRAGDVDVTSVDYNIYYRPIFSSVGRISDFILTANERITGKISGGYIKKTQVNFPGSYRLQDDFVGWEIQVTRTTEESTSSSLRNQTFVDSITEVFANAFLYPNSAIVRSKFSAEFFSQIPARAFDVRLLKVKIPNNYNPITRTYGQSAGAPIGLVGDFWNGEFAEEKAWTNNPAWCFYDLLTNKRYGMGKYLSEDYVDKWTLYEIAKYCDQLVSDGEGGLEPRFECNVMINSREEAYKVINDFASIFRGIVYYAGGTIQAGHDSPKRPIYTFTNANVIEGNFSYSSSSKRERHTVCIVRYNDRTNFYLPAIEYVQDEEAIKKFGIRELQLTAFGATSRGQARRYAKWALVTESLETESLSFSAGLEGSYLRPGDIINVHDYHRNGRRLGGRTLKVENYVDSGVVLLDASVPLTAGNLYNFNLLTPTYSIDIPSVTGSTDFDEIRHSNIQSFEIDGADSSLLNGYTQVVLPSSLEDEKHSIDGSLIWTIELADGVATPEINDLVSGQLETFRIISVTEDPNTQFDISAITYNELKFDLIESGLTFAAQKIDEVAPASPENLSLAERQIDVSTKVIDYSFTISSLSNVRYFYVYVKKDSDFLAGDTNGTTYLAAILDSSQTSGTYNLSSNGRYYFRVFARGSTLFSSSYASNNLRVVGINFLNSIEISSLRLDTEDTADDTNAAGTWASGLFEDESPVFVFQAGNVVGLDLVNDYAFRITIRQPNFSNTPSPVIYYEKTGHVFSNIAFPQFEFDIDTNMGLAGGPYRDFDIVVESMDYYGESSAGGNFLTNINSNSQNDAKYTNPNGYDIFYAFNPRPTGYFLTPHGSTCVIGPAASGLICTTQWISQDSEIVININTGELDDDVAGGFVYYRTSDFTENDARFLTNGVQRVEFLNIEGADSITVLPTDWGLVNTGYIALAFYDIFDVGIGIEDITGMYISNSVRIDRGSTADLTSIQNSINDLTLDVSNIYESMSNISGDLTNISGDLVVISGNVDYLSGVLPFWQQDIFNNTSLINYISGILPFWQQDIFNNTSSVSYLSGVLPFWQQDIFNNTTFINYLSGVVSNIIGDIIENASDIAEISGKIITICDSINLLSGIVEACCGFTGEEPPIVEDVSFDPTPEQILCAFTGDSGFLAIVGSGGYDSFDCYEVSEQSGALVYIHSGWESGWIAQGNFGGLKGIEDFEQYTVTLLENSNELTGGTGFATEILFFNNFSGAKGVEDFEYVTGDIVSGTSQISGSIPLDSGIGWSGNWLVEDNP